MTVDLPRPRWLESSGPESDVVLSTRCRIARNLAVKPFPWRASLLDSKETAETILVAADRSGEFRDAIRLNGAAVSSGLDAQLLQWRYASRDWMAGGPNRWLLIAQDTILSLLINEEDHLRLQSISPGLQVESVRARGERAASGIELSAPFARRPGIGYLTTSLTNAGTGMRISVLLHLAGTAAEPIDKLKDLLTAAASLGCTVRGLYGEGTLGTGELFQVSNTYTFGIDAEQTADRVSSAANYLIDAERDSRRRQFGSPAGRDRLARWTRETLSDLYAREASPAELLKSVSTLRLAVAEGMLPVQLTNAAEWVAIAGAEGSNQPSDDMAHERFLAVSRTAALRQMLRGLAI